MEPCTHLHNWLIHWVPQQNKGETVCMCLRSRTGFTSGCLSCYA